MKESIRLGFVASLSLVLAACASSPPAQQNAEKPASSAQAAQDYICPMDPEVRDTKASDCPKCGMKLVRADQAKQHEAH